MEALNKDDLDFLMKVVCYIYSQPVFFRVQLSVIIQNLSNSIKSSQTTCLWKASMVKTIL